MLIAQPGRMGPLRLRNRIIMGPMGTNYGTTDGFSTERDKLYYGERARGGAAMIITEAMVITAGARNHTNSMCLFHDRYIPGLTGIVDAIHEGGALAVGQINHRGALLKRSVLGMEPVTASDWHNPNTGEPARAITLPEIDAVKHAYLDSARRLHRAGYDAVELHAANGYLFQQFLSPRINRREDRYGGSIENRMRFLMETVALIRGELPGFPLMVRISATEYCEGGYTEADMIALCQALERAGVIAIDMSGGTNESPELSRYCIQPPSFARRFLEPYARPIAKAVGIPTIMAGRVIDPEDAEGILQAGSADFVAVCRALVADAWWPRKAFGEIKTPIRKCISCNVCFERLTLERDVACVTNPMVGIEYERIETAEPQLRKDASPPSGRKRILVLGAGVAGVEAARVAAGLGHQVEIWEKAAKPGGQMPLALAAPDKGDVAGVWTYRWEQIESLGVPVRTGVHASAESIRDFLPDLVVVATGAKPRSLPFPVKTRVPVLHAWDALLEQERVPRGVRVAIIGGGMVGIETADTLIHYRGVKATVIEGLPVIAKEMARNNRYDVLDRLAKSGARVFINAPVESIEGDIIWATVEGVRTRFEAGDLIISAIGPLPNRDIVPEVLRSGAAYVLAGDCNQIGDFMTAVRDGWMLALAIDMRLTHEAGEPARTAIHSGLQAKIESN
jgi:2,4-dienoyl-CoA reductase-like NADH-dependent reductase (Old Yellow Enzyme family)/NADPH-dependent 2,4-dienoyl-CoA reductase/sulfur reductase-like enzyme